MQKDFKVLTQILLHFLNHSKQTFCMSVTSHNLWKSEPAIKIFQDVCGNSMPSKSFDKLQSAILKNLYNNQKHNLLSFDCAWPCTDLWVLRCIFSNSAWESVGAPVSLWFSQGTDIQHTNIKLTNSMDFRSHLKWKNLKISDTFS